MVGAKQAPRTNKEIYSAIYVRLAKARNDQNQLIEENNRSIKSLRMEIRQRGLLAEQYWTEVERIKQDLKDLDRVVSSSTKPTETGEENHE